ncbi:MAG TPA: response regulator [bacterium]|nr:response regulator [bacterium]HNT64594.1 response regulator [bacterium]HOX84563.1 response regulator [bacterium]HPG45286.1 response regulator [bacterium]HPM98995.1 response regulator [bacterium]
MVLIASNDPEIRTALSERFRGETFNIRFALHSLDVLAQVIERETDILVLDLDMHGHVGIDVLPVIRKIRPRLPIVVISDDFTNRIRKIAAEQGMTYQAFKPKTRAEVGAIFTAAERILEKCACLHLVN